MKIELTNEIKEHLAKRINYVRKDIAHKTQSEFAYSLYVSRVYINQLENAKITVFPSELFFKQICEEYHVSYDWITLGKGMIFQEGSENQQLPSKNDTVYPLSEMQIAYSELLEDLQNMLLPENLSMDAYNKLINLYIVLSQPLFHFGEAIKKSTSKKEEISPELYETYYQELSTYIKVFLSQE